MSEWIMGTGKYDETVVIDHGGGDYEIVARIHGNIDDARLIAAAPETAAELEQIKRVLDRTLYELFINGLADTDAYRNGAGLIDWKVEKEAG